MCLVHLPFPTLSLRNWMEDKVIMIPKYRVNADERRIVSSLKLAPVGARNNSSRRNVDGQMNKWRIGGQSH